MVPKAGGAAYIFNIIQLKNFCCAFDVFLFVSTKRKVEKVEAENDFDTSKLSNGPA